MTSKVHALGAVAAAGVVAASVLVPLTTASASGGAGTVFGGGVNIRQSPDSSSAKVGSLPDGTKVTFACQTTGSSVQGPHGTSNIWNKIDGGYVSAAWVDSGANGGRVSGVPDCGGQSSSQKPQQQGSLTRAQLEAMFPGKVAETSRVEEGLPHLEKEMAARGITTPARKAAFLATVAHESGFDYAVGEHGYGTDVYRGRGYIQITGDFNYQAAGDALGVDLMGENQSTASTLPVSAKIAGWYWAEARTDSNEAADAFNMGRVSRNIGYDNTTGEDARRCESFKSAYQALSGQSVPGSLVCDRN